MDRKETSQVGSVAPFTAGSNEASANNLATILDALRHDSQFSPLELAAIQVFFEVCSTSIVNHDKEKEHEAFFEVARRSGIDLSMYHKEGGFIQALWVIYLASLKCILEETEYKYQTLESFLASYAGAFDKVDNKEKIKLFHTANWMAIMFKLIPARKNKGLAINVVPKLVEGWQVKYVTGSGQKPATALRVLIFQTEGHVKPFHRGRHHDDDYLHLVDDHHRGTSGGGSEGSDGVIGGSAYSSTGLKRGGSNSSGESTDDLERSCYNKKSRSILAISETIEAADHQHDLEWEKHAELFKKTDFNILKHGNHGFKPINHEKDKKDKDHHHQHTKAHHKKEKSESTNSDASWSNQYPSMLIPQPNLQPSITQLLIKDAANGLSSGILSRDVSAMLKDGEIANSLSISFFGSNQEYIFDPLSPNGQSAQLRPVRNWNDSLTNEWLEGVSSSLSSPRTDVELQTVSNYNPIHNYSAASMSSVTSSSSASSNADSRAPKTNNNGSELSAIDSLMLFS